MFLKNSRRRLTTIANSGSVNFGLCTPAQERAAQAPEAPPTSHAALRNSPDTQRARLIPVTKHAV